MDGTMERGTRPSPFFVNGPAPEKGCKTCGKPQQHAACIAPQEHGARKAGRVKCIFMLNKVTIRVRFRRAKQNLREATSWMTTTGVHAMITVVPVTCNKDYDSAQTELFETKKRFCIPR